MSSPATNPIVYVDTIKWYFRPNEVWQPAFGRTLEEAEDVIRANIREAMGPGFVSSPEEQPHSDRPYLGITQYDKHLAIAAIAFFAIVAVAAFFVKSRLRKITLVCGGTLFVGSIYRQISKIRHTILINNIREWVRVKIQSNSILPFQVKVDNAEIISSNLLVPAFATRQEVFDVFNLMGTNCNKTSPGWNYVFKSVKKVVKKKPILYSKLHHLNFTLTPPQ